MSGIVGVIANDSARYSLFWSCMDHLQLPPGWKKEHVIGGDWCGSRNKLCEYVLESDAEYLWFMDDDHAFAPDLLLKLLRWERKLVVPVCLMRSSPFMPVTFAERLDDDPNGNARYLPVYYPEHEKEGLIELEAGGCAGMLIHRDVIAAMKSPWFEYGFASEDLLFCQKAKELGFTIHCDLSARLGHITTAVVYPANDDQGEWVVGFNIGRDTNLIVPWPTNEIEREMSAESEKVLA